MLLLNIKIFAFLFLLLSTVFSEDLSTSKVTSQAVQTASPTNPSSLPSAPTPQRDGKTLQVKPIKEQVRLTLTKFPETEIVVSWLSNKVLNAPTVFYTPITGEKSTTFKKVAQQVEQDNETKDLLLQYVCKLTDLLPNTVYQYQVGDDVNAVGLRSQLHHFKTFSHSKPEAVVGFFADMGVYEGAQAVARFLAGRFEHDALVHIGDLSYGLEESVWDFWGEMIEPVTSRVPYLVSPGNWDVRGNATNIFRHRFLSTTRHLLPNGHIKPAGILMQFYYSFNVSSAHVVVISPYEKFDKDSEQYKWVENDLIQANKHRDVTPWIIAAFHNPFYSSSDGHVDKKESDLLFIKIYEELFHKYQVDLAVTGHDHGYERSLPVYKNEVKDKSKNGPYINQETLVHVLVGVGGAKGDGWVPLPEWSAVRESTCGVFNMHIFKNDSLYLEYVRHDYTVGDSFWLIKKKPTSFSWILHNWWVFLLMIVFTLVGYKYYLSAGQPKIISFSNGNLNNGQAIPGGSGLLGSLGKGGFSGSAAATPSNGWGRGGKQNPKINSFV